MCLGGLLRTDTTQTSKKMLAGLGAFLWAEVSDGGAGPTARGVALLVAQRALRECPQMEKSQL